MKFFLSKNALAPRSNKITCLVKNVCIMITKALNRDILKLELCDLQIFLHKSHLTLDNYDLFEACCRVAERT